MIISVSVDKLHCLPMAVFEIMIKLCVKYRLECVNVYDTNNRRIATTS